MLTELLAYLWQTLYVTASLLAFLLLPSLLLAFLLQLLTNAIRHRLAMAFGINSYVYLTAPGVMVHELSHAFFCLVFRHKIIEMRLFFPEADGTLGYVNHSYNPGSGYQRCGNFIIGTGPIWLGALALYVISCLLLPASAFSGQGVGCDGGFGSFCMNALSTAGNLFLALLHPSLWLRWQTWVWLYLILAIGSHITLSRPDIEGAFDGLVSLVVAALLLNLLTLWLHDFSLDAMVLLTGCLSLVYGMLAYAFLMLLAIWIVLRIIIRGRGNG